jgi:polyisoprenoid-binding protein YceI
MKVAAKVRGQEIQEGNMAQSATQVRTGALGLPLPGKYEIDPIHTSVEFVARHMLSKVRGRFTDFSGTIEVADNPEDSSVNVEIQVGSVQTNSEQRDGHLKSGDFFELEKFPVISFNSTGVRATGNDTFELDGDLKIKNVTRPVTLKGEYLGAGHDPRGGTVLGASARTTINREDFGITWNVAVEAGGFMVSKKIDLEIEVEAHRAG